MATHLAYAAGFAAGLGQALMRILILNWRDVRSPRAGGAELLTHEVARRLVAPGHEVTWFTSRPDGLPRRR